MLRSALLGAFPALTVTASDSGGNALTCLRYEILAPSLAIALFSGEVATVVLQQPSSGITFGADPDTPDALNFIKRYTNDSDNNVVGTQVPGGATAMTMRANPTISLAAVGGTYEGPANTGGAVLNVTFMASYMIAAGITPFTAAEFALQLVQPTESASFTIAAGGAP
jgi:hypothetical protein